ncbi:MAG: DUF3313 family protein [Pseudomonadales bacterium]
MTSQSLNTQTLHIAFWKKVVFVSLSAIAIAFAVSLSVESDAPEISHDGLHLTPTDDVALLYLKPDADFSPYKRFVLLEAYVAFKKNWQRDTKVAGRRVSNKDMEKIKVEVAQLFQDSFKEVLETDGGYAFVDKADDDVLILRPAIIDLDITAPDIMVPGRVTQYVASSGAATLYLEVFDSVSGEILARIVDRKRTRDSGYMQWSSSVSNRADAKRMFKRWATMLREGFDDLHSEAQAADKP